MSKRVLDVQGIGMTSQRTRNRLVKFLMEQGISHEGVLQAMGKTPRHLFVDEALASRSYENISLPIGHGQTISQPYIVARMSQLLVEAQTEKLNKVLEIGTGSGYQAAVLSSLVGEIHSVERIYALYQATNTLLHALNYKNIHTHLATNEVGLNRYAPYDGIIVTAAPEEVPQALLQQLKMGGRLVIPLGKQGEDQMLKVITRVEPEKFVTENHETVQFVPFIQDLH